MYKKDMIDIYNTDVMDIKDRNDEYKDGHDEYLIEVAYV